MNSEPEREMVTGLRTVDNEPVRFFNLVRIAVARDLPHGHLVAFLDSLPVQFGVA
jgi:hypothetical protein